MTRAQELEMYLAVCDCRTLLVRGYPPSEAAAWSVRGREVLADEVKKLALTAVDDCAGARQRMIEAGRKRMNSAFL